jgi:hypothetical protein
MDRVTSSSCSLPSRVDVERQVALFRPAFPSCLSRQRRAVGVAELTAKRSPGCLRPEGGCVFPQVRPSAAASESVRKDFTSSVIDKHEHREASCDERHQGLVGHHRRGVV